MRVSSASSAPMLLAILLDLSPSWLAAKPRTVTWWITNSMVKVRPLDPQPVSPTFTAEISAGRNEFEAFQLVLRANLADIENIDLELSDFRTRRGDRISSHNTIIYCEQYLHLARPSTAASQAGYWPDPLIPRIDSYAAERRNAFPIRLQRGRNQPLWIEFFVPASAAPGVYNGVLRILRNRAAWIVAPVKVKVWAFTLPPTASLKSSFGLNGTTILKQHRGTYTDDADLYALTRLYAKAALLHRISIHGGSMVAPKPSVERGRMYVDWTAYDNEVRPFLDGTVIPQGEPLAGAKATTVEVRTPAGETMDGSYWLAWAKHFREKGWYERLFVYLWDEPKSEDATAVLMRGRAALSADPTLRTLVTSSLVVRLEEVVKIWAPLVNCLVRKEADDFCGSAPELDAYSSQRKDGKDLWFYQSCASHGCNIVGGPYFNGWPSYMIDAPAAGNRVMPWLAWKYQIDGELYYSMNEAYAGARDPWQDVYLFGGNGDGTLFYPGRADRIGGHVDIPIESIRLKLIREGMEDYEYLALLAKLSGRNAADEFAAQIVQKPYLWETDPERFLQVREQLGERLNRLTVMDASKGDAPY